MRLVETVLTGLASGDTQELGRLCESFVHRITVRPIPRRWDLH
jgi:hypothetical protein